MQGERGTSVRNQHQHHESKWQYTNTAEIASTLSTHVCDISQALAASIDVIFNIRNIEASPSFNLIARQLCNVSKLLRA